MFIRGKVWYIWQIITKIKPFKLVVAIDNLWMTYSFAKLLSIKIFIHPLLPNIIATKLPHYMVLMKPQNL